MKVNRVKWNINMYYRCVERAERFEKAEAGKLKKDKIQKNTITAEGPGPLEPDTENEFFIPGGYVNSPVQPEVPATSQNKYTNAVGIRQIIECQILNSATE